MGWIEEHAAKLAIRRAQIEKAQHRRNDRRNFGSRISGYVIKVGDLFLGWGTSVKNKPKLYLFQTVEQAARYDTWRAARTSATRLKLGAGAAKEIRFVDAQGNLQGRCLLHLAEVAKTLGMTPGSITYLESKGRFPKRVAEGTDGGWDKDEILAWLKEREKK
jgi:predicted DNA-binding transcriptional regulator AlpA